MKKVFFLLIGLISGGIFCSTVWATTIFSPVLEMAADPGASQAGVVKVYNETDNDLYLTASIERFAAAGENGQPVYLPPDKKDIFLGWFKLAQKEIVLKPKQVVLVPFTVSIPKTAIPGGYYVVIFWQSQTKPVTDQPAVGISSKVGTLIFLKVNGALDEKGELVEFFTQPQKKYIWGLPVNFSVRFKNNGNIYLQPEGEVKITNWLGQTVVLPVNPAKRLVLPDSIRRFDVAWSQGSGNGWGQFWSALKTEVLTLPFGPIKANLTLNYGLAKTENLTQGLDFYLIPYHLIIAVIVVIMGLIFFIKINKKIKKLKASAKLQPPQG